MNRNYWLLLEKSDETRISKGIEGYQDKTGESYQYDSLVPNHKNLATGDFVVLRKENEILGIGKIADISESADVKIRPVIEAGSLIVERLRDLSTLYEQRVGVAAAVGTVDLQHLDGVVW